MNLMKKSAIVASTLAMLLSGAFAQATTIYETGVNDPWGNQSNDSAMTSAFGTGSWTKSNGFNMAMFSGASMVYLDGSDSSANELSSFIATNQTSIQSYVTNGGHLFINSAPNQGDSFNMGFGVVTLNYANYSPNATITAAGVAAGLSDGGIATTYTGNYFGHSTVSGPISNLVQGNSGTVFGAMDYGSGFVAFGGQTTTNWHSPAGDAETLLVNELKYVATASVSAVPEPETYAMLLAGLGLMGFMTRRKSGKKEA